VVVGGSEDSKVYIWDLQTREILQVLEGHRGKSGSLRLVRLVNTTNPSHLDVVMAVAVRPIHVKNKCDYSPVCCLPDPSNEEHHSIRRHGKGPDDTTLV